MCKAERRCLISRQTLSPLWKEIRMLATKWNIQHPPIMAGRMEYDELILS